MYTEILVLFSVAITIIIICKVIMKVYSKKMKDIMTHALFNSINIGDHFIYRATKGMSRPKYSVVKNKTIDNGVYIIHYFTIVWDSFFRRMECDGPLYKMELQEFMRKYEKIDYKIDYFEYNIEGENG